MVSTCLMARHPRIRAVDVAREAGVSTATVSYVLNQTPGQKISAATTARVREAATRLGYVANTAAQALARGTSGFVILDMSDFVSVESATAAAKPILKILQDAGYEALQTWWPKHNDPQEFRTRLLRTVRSAIPSALITVLPLDEDFEAELRANGLISVSSLVSSLEAMTPFLTGPVTRQVDYLIDQGHTHIFYVGGLHDIVPEAVAARSAAGEAVAEARGARWTRLEHNGDPDHFQQVLQAALSEYPDASAIAAYNDRDALVAMFALHRLGVQIPERMAVIGIDDEVFAELTLPPLTTLTPGFELLDPRPHRYTEAVTGEGLTGIIQIPEIIVTTELHVRGSA